MVTKDYKEVLDEYSSHEFMIRKGVVLDQTPEYQSYQRINHKNWTMISKVITQLQTLLANYQILLANIDGKKVNTYSILNRKLTNYELFDCIVNQDEMGKLLNNPQIKFAIDKNKAASRI